MNRRSFVIVAVLVIVASALLVATSVLYLAQADIAGRSRSRDRVQARTLAISGLNIVMNRLQHQRAAILQGDLPTLTDETIVIYETSSPLGRRGVVRLLPMGFEGSRVASEAGKLDLNAVDAAALERAGRIDPDLAAAIIAHREETLGRPYQSVGELLIVPGMSPELLYGPLELVAVTDDARGIDKGLRDRVSVRLASDEMTGLVNLVTVYAAEPDLQKSGVKRINLNVEWSDELAKRIDDRFGQGASAAVKRVVDATGGIENDAAIIRALLAADLPPESWPDILDALSTTEGDYLLGRLDLNTASEAALRGLPGITQEQATEIVRRRDALESDQRATICWPVIEGIIEPDAFVELAGRLTTRSWTFRVRIAAGEIDDNAHAGRGEQIIENPVIYEAVVDLCDPQPRVAYLREITVLQTAAHLVAGFELDQTGDDVSGSAAAPGESNNRAPRDGNRNGDQAESENEADADLNELANEEASGASATDPEPEAMGNPGADSDVEPGETRGAAGSADSSPTPPPARRRVGRWHGGR